MLHLHCAPTLFDQYMGTVITNYFFIFVVVNFYQLYCISSGLGIYFDCLLVKSLERCCECVPLRQGPMEDPGPTRKTMSRKRKS